VPPELNAAAFGRDQSVHTQNVAACRHERAADLGDGVDADWSRGQICQQAHLHDHRAALNIVILTAPGLS
jgi:hypothetical protein